jgi:hypothetical protein
MDELSFEINNKVIFGVLILLLIIATSAGVYFFMQYQNLKKIVGNPTDVAKNEAKMLVEKVGQYMTLPTDEEPTIVTVTDIEKVKDQPFFAKAKNGDKVIVYKIAKKAILYSATENKILEVGPLIMQSDQASQSAQQQETSGEPEKTTIQPTRKVLISPTIHQIPSPTFAPTINQ